MLKFIKPLPKTTSTITSRVNHISLSFGSSYDAPQRLLRTTTLFSSLRFHQVGHWISLSLSLSPSPSRYRRPCSCIFLSQTGPKIERSLPLFGIPAFITLREICTKPLFGGWGLGNPDPFCWIPLCHAWQFFTKGHWGRSSCKASAWSGPRSISVHCPVFHPIVDNPWHKTP